LWSPPYTRRAQFFEVVVSQRVLVRRPLVVSVVSVEALLEGAISETDALAALQRFTLQGLHLAQARRSAWLRRRTARRSGENDARLVATAESIGADVVAADCSAFERLGARYLRFR
jgi:predicted nucleic acid-binding protein